MTVRIFADEDSHCYNGILMGSVGLGGSGDNQSQDLELEEKVSVFFCHLGTLWTWVNHKTC